jgi:hypothetical protein
VSSGLCKSQDSGNATIESQFPYRILFLGKTTTDPYLILYTGCLDIKPSLLLESFVSNHGQICEILFDVKMYLLNRSCSTSSYNELIRSIVNAALGLNVNCIDLCANFWSINTILTVKVCNVGKKTCDISGRTL